MVWGGVGVALASDGGVGEGETKGEGVDNGVTLGVTLGVTDVGEGVAVGRGGVWFSPHAARTRMATARKVSLSQK